ncbi:MAG: translation initiation factor IF-2 N-terminal domain-containing protein, partial [Candidatus Electryoneaceae bacterium]|nr:translation initiation factor IF-2 N-terminal domain-containing protein [Candidatus Electryoneaceae bacterium]
MTQRKKKTRKVADVARGLKIQTPTIISFLEERGYEVKRGINQPVTDEMYMMMLKKFDNSAFLKLQSDQASLVEQSHKREAERIRAQEQADLLAARHTLVQTDQADDTVVSSTSDGPAVDASEEKPKKIGLPQRQALKIVHQAVEPEADKPKVVDAPVQVEKTPTPQPTAPVQSDEPIPAEAPKKKRPSKTKRVDDTVPSDVSAQVEPKKKSPRRRKRRAPRKTVTDQPVVEAVPAKQAPVEQVRPVIAEVVPPVRPTDEKKDISVPQPEQAEKVKPRKIELPKGTPLVIIKQAPPPPPPEPEKPKKKRRPKPPKRAKRPVTEETTATGKPGQEEKTSTSKTKESGAERKRSRRRKPSSEQQKRSQDASAGAQPSADKGEPTAKKKPRRKKALPKTGTPKETTTEVAREKTGRGTGGKKDEKTGVASESPKKRSRGRRKKPGTTPGTTTSQPQTQSKKKRAGRGKKRAPIDQREINASIKQTMAAMDGSSSRRRHYSRGPKETGVADDGPQTIQVTEFITTQELANLLDVPVQDVIRRGMDLGALMSINQRLDSDLIELLAEEFEAEIEFIKEEAMEVEEEVLA